MANESTSSVVARVALGSLAIGLAVLALKIAAARLTGSIALYSDALESVVNVVTAIVALVAVRLAARPADAALPYGYGKAEYFSAVIIGVFIALAAILIFAKAWDGFRAPQPFTADPVGLGISMGATALNAIWAWTLMRIGRRESSLSLVADGKHLMTDVWTSVGVVVGVLLVAVTGILRLDPVIALLVGLNIIWTGYRLISSSVGGLLDRALDPEKQAVIDEILAGFATDEVRFHAVRTREAGHRSYVTMHVLVPGSWSVARGHDLAESVERRLRERLQSVDVATHLEPIEDPRAYEEELGVEAPGSSTGES